MNNYKISMSSREAVTRDLRIFISAGTANEREKIRRSRITTLRDDRSLYDNSNSGFTLIELLVVVLIIGILAAVALPQYTLAVNKSRFANLRSMAHPYLQAMRSYHLANGEWPNDMDELEVEPAGMSRINQLADNYSCAYNDEVFCCMQGAKKDGWASGMMCGRKDYSFVYSCLLDNTTFSPIGQDLCLAKTTDDNANKLCKALSQATSYHSGGITTPDGRQSTYNYYVVK